MLSRASGEKRRGKMKRNTTKIKSKNHANFNILVLENFKCLSVNFI